MKTTITIDNDVAEFLQEQCRLQNKQFDQVVNETLRRGMTPAVQANAHDPHQVVTHSSGYAPGFDPEKIKEFLYDEDIEDFLRKSCQ